MHGISELVNHTHKTKPLHKAEALKSSGWSPPVLTATVFQVTGLQDSIPPKCRDDGGKITLSTTKLPVKAALNQFRDHETDYWRKCAHGLAMPSEHHCCYSWISRNL